METGQRIRGKKVSRNKLILQHLYEYYQQKENEEKETTMVVTKEYVDGRINAVKCEVLEEVLQVITGGIQEKTQQWRKEAEPNEETAGLWKTDNKTKEKAETDIFLTLLLWQQHRNGDKKGGTCGKK